MGRMPPKPRGPVPTSPRKKQPEVTSKEDKAHDDEEKLEPKATTTTSAAAKSTEVEENLSTINLGELQDTIAGAGRRTSPRKKVQSKSSSDEDEDDPVPPSPKPKPGPASKTRSPAKTTTKEKTAPAAAANISIDESITDPKKGKSKYYQWRVLIPSKYKKVRKNAKKASEEDSKKPTNIKKKPTKTTIVIDSEAALEGQESEGEGKEVVEEILVSEKTKMEEDGRNIFALMSQEDTEEFLSRLERQCSPLDRASIPFREKNIKWHRVAFGAYGDYQCRCVWAFFRSHTRKFRIMYELINEVKFKLADSVTFQFKLIESMPGFPQKPPANAFNVYNRERWNEVKESVQDPKDVPNFVKFQVQCKEEFNCLSRYEKEKYEERVGLLQAEYEKQVKAFYAENPGVAKLVERLHNQEAIRKEKLKKLRSEVKAKKRQTDQALKRKESALLPKLTKEKKKVLKLPNPYPDAPQPPQTPVVLFIQAKLNRIEPPPLAEDIPHCKTRFLNKWKKLGASKKVKWIDYCISSCEEFLVELEKYREKHPGYSISKSLKVKQLLTREEMALWENEHGKPPPPKGTVFELFMEELLQSDPTLSELSDNDRDVAARSKWTELDWYHKEMYRMKYKISIVEYKKKIQEFISGLPEFMKEWCMERIPKKFHKVCNEVDTLPPEATTLPMENKNDSNDQPPPPKKKKRETKKPKENAVAELPEPKHGATSFHEEEEYSSVTNPTEDPLADTPEHQHHVFEQPEPSPKKRKRKQRDPELITGDIFSDSQSESHTDGESEQRRTKGGVKRAILNSSTPIFQQEVTPDMINELRTLRGKTGLDEKFSDVVKQQVELMQEADNRTVHHITEAFVRKHKRSKYPVSTDVTQSMR